MVGMNKIWYNSINGCLENHNSWNHMGKKGNINAMMYVIGMWNMLLECEICDWNVKYVISMWNMWLECEICDCNENMLS